MGKSETGNLIILSWVPQIVQSHAGIQTKGTLTPRPTILIMGNSITGYYYLDLHS